MSSDENCIEILEPDLCIICLDNNKSLNSLPCLNNHNALICSECKSTLEGHPCVLCRMVPNEYLPREPTTVRVTDIVVTTRSIRPKRFCFYALWCFMVSICIVIIVVSISTEINIILFLGFIIFILLVMVATTQGRRNI